MSDNNQALPPGMQERAAAASQPAPQQQYQPPSQAIPEYQQQPAQQPQAQQPAPAPNPMLSRFSQEEAPAAPPTQHLEQPGTPPAEPAPTPPKAAAESSASIQDLVGDLSADVQVKPSIAYIETVCKGSEVDLARAFNKAVEYGDSGLIDEVYLREKLGENADAVIQQASYLFEYSAHKAQEAMRTVYDAAGGEEVLTQAAKYFNASADPAERAEIQYLLDSGNKDLMARAARRIVDFAQQSGMTYQKGGQPLGNPASAKGLSKQEYIEQISAPNLSPEQYDNLRKQRQLGRQQGL